MTSVFTTKRIMEAFECRNKDVEPHMHDFFELVYVIRGKAEHFIGNTKSVIEQGDFIFIDYNTVHSYHSIGNQEFCVFNCLFKSEFVDRSLVHCRRFATLLNHYLIKMNVKSLMINPLNHQFRDKEGTLLPMLQKILVEFLAERPGYIEMLRCMVIELIITTMRLISIDKAVDTDVIGHIVSDISENYMHKLSLKTYACEYNYSIPHLSNKFKDTVGICFSDYLEKIRMEEACRLLANTDMKIFDIAASVGYRNVNFFHKIFRRIYGITPLDMRKKMFTA